MKQLLKQIKTRVLIRLMTALGFGGMVGFCLSSCQSQLIDSDQSNQQEPECGCTSVKVIKLEPVEEELPMQRMNIVIVDQGPKIRLHAPQKYGAIMPPTTIVK